MKIISWNCNGKFRDKYKQIQARDADIYVIQECENPKTSKNSDYRKFAANALWIGTNNTKGLGVFCKPSVSLRPLDWNPYCLELFLPVRINGETDLLAVWAKRPYIEEYYVYQSIHRDKYTDDMIVLGDFNSNAIWDKPRNTRSHTNVVAQLEEIGLCSVYHDLYAEKQGEESRKTFYLYRHKDRGYHIDHCFANRNKVKSMEVLDESWLAFSDHIPLEIILR